MPERDLLSRRRHLLTAAAVPSFYLAEWLLVAASASVFSLLRLRGLADREIWLVLWAANLAISGTLVRCNDLLRVDMTLMQGLRKLTDAAIHKTGGFGRLLELVIFVRLLLWDGPCQLLIFFRNRLPSPLLRVGFFVAASGLQMFLWAQIYELGYQGITDFFLLQKGS
jgi:hypothetical protein